jgi:hypothetical protein
MLPRRKPSQAQLWSACLGSLASHPSAQLPTQEGLFARVTAGQRAAGTKLRVQCASLSGVVMEPVELATLLQPPFLGGSNLAELVMKDVDLLLSCDHLRDWQALLCGIRLPGLTTVGTEKLNRGLSLKELWSLAARMQAPTIQLWAHGSLPLRGCNAVAVG